MILSTLLAASVFAAPQYAADLTGRDIVWPDGKKAAFYLSFDDGCLSQPKNVFPLLQEYRVHGTFYICAGWDSFKDNEKLWVTDNPYVHIGNHTFSHGKIENAAAFEKEVADCNAAIRRVTPGKPWPRDVAFGIPGTETMAKLIPSASEAEIDAVFARNHLVQRLPYHGFPVNCKTIPEMEAYIDRVVRDGGIGHLDFHGVGGDWLDPGLDYFKAVLKKLDSVREKVYFAPYEELYAYAQRQRKVALARQAAAEGIVLLKNEGGVLPLAKDAEIALVGFTGYFCHRMGWGSGDMMKHTPVQIDEGLEKAGVRLDQGFAKVYRDELAARKAKGLYDRINLDWWKWTFRFDEVKGFDKAKFAETAAGKRGKTCVVVIGRNCGESEDLKDAPGSFRLHWEEDLLLKDACANFDDVVVVLNACGVLDTSFMEKYPVKALVFAPMLGEVTGDAVADVLTGAVNPSGKTVDTWAKHYYDYSTTDCFGALDLPYREGIYVGYRHFATKGVEPRYPFGFGLSYTTFSLEPLQRGEVKVTNTGKVAGAEVVQCYVAAPSVKLDQPRYKLCGFRKTKVLAPGESEIVRVSADLWTCPSWCEKTSAWVLEPGKYWFLVGDSLATLKEAWTEDVTELKSRKDGSAVAPSVELPKPTRKVTMNDVLAGTATAEELVAQFDDAELALILNGRVFDAGFAVEGGTGVGGAKEGKVKCEAGEFWSSEKYAIPVVTCADGPSGVRLGNFNDPVDTYNPQCAELVHWPSGTAVAQGWNEANAEAFGRAVADDMARSDIDGWLAPGVNIHRNPLCGRNFEYFSEDPLLAGKMGAAIIRGVERKADGTLSGRYATVKHFCTNNQEFERGAENNIVDERTLREIYLKPFEIAVKEGHPHALMTSYNQLNGDYVATTRRLVTDVLRGEWGFTGLVMTDWWNSAVKKRHPFAGNDIVMPGVRGFVEEMIAGLKDGTLRRADAQACAVRIVKTLKELLAAR